MSLMLLYLHLLLIHFKTWSPVQEQRRNSSFPKDLLPRSIAGKGTEGGPPCYNRKYV